MLGEISQMEKEKHHMVSLIFEIVKKKKNELTETVYKGSHQAL